jgi:hypothetical protein
MKNTPKVTPQHIQSIIKDEAFYFFPGTTLTVCCLTLLNGFTVLGESACACPANFNQELGEELARKDAEKKIWMLEGYLLKQELFDADEG